MHQSVYHHERLLLRQQRVDINFFKLIHHSFQKS
jgi:hypothetical protein